MIPIEISDNLFCGRTDFCDAAISNGCEGLSCGECHRKWPTPEQFKEEYGEKYPDDGAVYARCKKIIGWYSMPYYWAKTSSEYDDIVCACTPFIKPSKDWRPQ
jgi:hypothetical protein